MIRSRITQVAGALLIVLGIWLVQSDRIELSPTPTVEIDLDQALVIETPKFEAFLKPVSFETPDGKSGWAVRIPGNHPIATPAYAARSDFATNHVEEMYERLVSYPRAAHEVVRRVNCLC